MNFIPCYHRHSGSCNWRDVSPCPVCCKVKQSQGHHTEQNLGHQLTPNDPGCPVHTGAAGQVASEYLTCGHSKLRRSVSVKHILDFKDFVQQKEYKIFNIFFYIDYMSK